MFSIIINVQNAILKSFDSFIHVGRTLDMVQSESFIKPQEVHLEERMSTDSSGSFLNKFSPNPSLIIMPVTILWMALSHERFRSKETLKMYL